MKESKWKQFLGVWNTKTIVGVAIGAALFGVLMVFGGIKIFSNTSLTSAMVVVVVVAALFGPVLGLFVGLLPLYGAKISEGIFTVKHAIIYVITCIVGNIVAFGLVTPLLTSLFYSQELAITWLQAASAIVSNGVVLIVIGIPFLFLLAKRNASKTNLKKED